MDIKVGDLVLLKDEVLAIGDLKNTWYEVFEKCPDNKHAIRINAIDDTSSCWTYDSFVKKVKRISKNEFDYPETIEDEYGIRRDQEYKIVLDLTKNACGGREGLKGIILNFSPTKTVLKTKEGLFIFESSLIKEMFPTKTNN